MSRIVSLCKRRGFVYPSAEIYGGTGSVWDFGPLGVLLKNNIKNEWWRAMVQENADIVGIDSSVITRREVLKASGHEQGFVDPLVECKICHTRFRADQPETISDHFTQTHKDKTPEGNITDARAFNLMFKTFMGPVADDENMAYLRPETAQGIFVNFKNILESSRGKLPFGIAQIGKSFRNEITPGNFIFRTREFEQMEMEFFVNPDEAESYYKKWIEERFNWYKDLGIKQENLRLRPHAEEELAHYAMAATDVEYKFPFGWSELEGIANRQDFDLQTHEKHSGRDLKYFDEETKKKFWPYVVEPAAGVDRAALAFLVDAYEEKNQKSNIKNQNNGMSSTSSDNNYSLSEDNSESKGNNKKQERAEGETVLHFHPKLAPIKAAVFPLVKKDKLPEIARGIYDDLKKHYMVQYDESGSVGRRYRRQDEIGTPWCITVDFDSLDDKTVTVRDRDTMEQERIEIKNIKTFIEEKLEG